MRGFDSSFGDVQFHGHLAIAAIAIVGEDHGLSLLEGQLVERVANPVAQPGRRDVALDVVDGRRRYVELLLLAGAAVLAADTVDAATVGEQAEPRSQRSTRGIKAVRELPQQNEHLLGDVLGHGLVVQDAPTHAEHQPGIPSIGLGQRLRLPCHQAGSENPV